MDRASGSGVFARDPDALLDLIELEPTEALMQQEENKAICNACKMYLDSRFAWQDDLSQDDLLSCNAMWNYCETIWTMADDRTEQHGRERKGKSKEQDSLEN